MGIVNTVGRAVIHLGVDPRRLRHASNFARYMSDRRTWLKQGGKIDEYFPILEDYNEGAGVANGHYFHMDLLVASFVAKAKPERHLDIGSRIDGFVAHVAAFRNIDVMDIRPLSIPAHPQISFVQANLMKLNPTLVGATDSLSCLHVLEHFGLGRYGDPIDPAGHLPAFSNMADLVRPGGNFYFASPVGKPAVMFNAHRIFDPIECATWAVDKLSLERFDYVDDSGSLHLHAQPEDAAGLKYGCGIYSFRRK